MRRAIPRRMAIPAAGRPGRPRTPAHRATLHRPAVPRESTTPRRSAPACPRPRPVTALFRLRQPGEWLVGPTWVETTADGPDVGPSRQRTRITELFSPSSGPDPAAARGERRQVATGIVDATPHGSPADQRETDEHMCGICGEVTFDGSSADTAAVDRMVHAVVPRGPDGEGSWSAGRVAFGHRRLSIIDLSDAGAQPMVDDEYGVTVVFNGCIYNHRQLRAELEGHGYQFSSTSDTEVIVKGYHRWGIDLVDHLHGMFAFVVYEH